MAIGRGAGFVGAKSGSGLTKKLFIVTVGVGGGAMSQAQLDGIVNGLTTGVTLVAPTTVTEAYTVVGIANTFTADSSVSAVIALEGGAAPSTTTGQYFAANTLSVTATFEPQE